MERLALPKHSESFTQAMDEVLNFTVTKSDRVTKRLADILENQLKIEDGRVYLVREA